MLKENTYYTVQESNITLSTSLSMYSEIHLYKGDIVFISKVVDHSKADVLLELVTLDLKKIEDVIWGKEKFDWLKEVC